MRVVGLLAALIMAAPVAQGPPLIPASLLLSTDSLHIDEKLLTALRAMSAWEFEPALSQGRPIAVQTTFTTSFSIR